MAQTKAERAEVARRYDAAPKRRAARALYATTSQCKAIRARYEKTDRMRAFRSATSARWKMEHPERARGQKLVRKWRILAHRMLVIQEMGGVCIDCGNGNPIMLHFDHRNPRLKKFDLSGGRFSSGRRMDAMRQEASKCDLRCANCHTLKTWLKSESGRRKAGS